MAIVTHLIAGYSDEQVERLCHNTYQINSQYQWINPKTTLDDWNSIRTVLDGTRPLGIFYNSKWSKILSKINGIFTIKLPSASHSDSYCIFRADEGIAAKRVWMLAEKMRLLCETEGYSKLVSLKRILNSCEEYGNLLFYRTECIKEFKEKTQRMIADLEYS